MHIKPDTDIVSFLKEVQKCASEVFFETPEGDRLALKSILSQYIFCTIASNQKLLSHGTIRFKQEEDKKLLDKFLCEETTGGISC